jgi:hypothetical protein
MINFKWENHNFYTIKDLLDERDVIQIKKDVVRECLDNYIEGYPKFQSYPDLHTKYKTTSWKNLISKVTENVNKIKQCKLIKCWANYINDKSDYALHEHPTDFSCVYYLDNVAPQYGTYFIKDGKEIIILGYTNSLQIFDSKLRHELVFPPKEVLSKTPRLSVAFDFKLDL